MWLECPIHWKVVSSIPSQGTYLGCRVDPWWGCIWEANDTCFSLTFMSLSLPLSSFPSKIGKHILSWGFNKRVKARQCFKNIYPGAETNSYLRVGPWKGRNTSKAPSFSSVGLLDMGQEKMGLANQQCGRVQLGNYGTFLFLPYCS